MGFIDETFGTAPIILTQVMSANEVDAVTTRVSNLSPAGFMVALHEPDGSPDGGSHIAETVGYIAIHVPDPTGCGATYNGQTGGLAGDLAFQAGTASVGESWESVTYATGQFTGSIPLAFASMQTAGSGLPAAVRYQNSTGSGVQLLIQEAIPDAGIATTAAVGYFAIEPGDIWVDLNGDKAPDTIFDAQVEACKAVVQTLIDQGLSDVADVVLIVFGGSARYIDLNPQTPDMDFHAKAGADQNANDTPDIIEILDGLGAYGGSTYFQPPLSYAHGALSDGVNPHVTPSADGLGMRDATNNNPITENGNVLFLSDGKPFDIFHAQVAMLRQWADNVRAFGVGPNASVDVNDEGGGGTLRDIDPTAQLFMTPHGLIQAMVSAIDTNRDGERDYVEPGMGDVVVYIDADNDGNLDPGELWTTTDANGNYSFSGLNAGTYYVRQVVPGSFAQTFPDENAAWEVTLGSEEDRYMINFGNNYVLLPVADDLDYATIDEDTSLTIQLADLLANDPALHPGDAELDPLGFYVGKTCYFSRVNQPMHGTIAFDGAQIEYTPHEDWFGQDTFTYVVTLGGGQYFKATVEITVNPVNDAPDVENTVYRILAGETLHGLLASDVDGDSLIGTIYAQPKYGTIQVEGDGVTIDSANGTFVYQPDAAGWTGVDRFFVSFSDGVESTGVFEVAVYVCERTNVILNPPDLLINDDALYGSNWGGAMDANGSMMIVGATTSSNTPVLVYQFDGIWAEVASFEPPTSGEGFGCSVAVSGNTAVVGAPFHGVSAIGGVYVFADEGAGWAQSALLTAEDWAQGEAQSGSQFGYSVAISDDGNT
ncbi:MAG: cadherin-like domain-containing protein, partial [Pirellulaceae bacterium]|nr:cadherin-like domain-containing protein [Pirellulaceae bacterium]